jgi:hypothetical protein
VRPPGAQGEIRQEGLRLARGQGARASVGLEQEAAQEPEAELRHGPDG